MGDNIITDEREIRFMELLGRMSPEQAEIIKDIMLEMIEEEDKDNSGGGSVA